MKRRSFLLGAAAAPPAPAIAHGNPPHGPPIRAIARFPAGAAKRAHAAALPRHVAPRAAANFPAP